MLIVIYDPRKGRSVGSIQTGLDDDAQPGDVRTYPLIGTVSIRRVNRNRGAKPTAVADIMPDGVF